MAIPDGATLAQASTLPMNGLTAMGGLEMLGLHEGDTLAVAGGAGLLGSYVIGVAAILLEALRGLGSAGRLKLRVARELPPEDAAKAHRLMEGGGLRGRAVIVFQSSEPPADVGRRAGPEAESRDRSQ